MVSKTKLHQIGHVMSKYTNPDKILKKEKRCPICGIEVDDKLKFCPNCNHVFFVSEGAE